MARIVGVVFGLSVLFTSPVKDKNGKTIIGKEGQLDGWAEHFEELLNRPSLLHLPPQTFSQLTRTFQLTARNQVGMRSGKLL